MFRLLQQPHPRNSNFIRTIKQRLPISQHYLENSNSAKRAINSTNINGYSPLSIAIINDNFIAVKFIIETGTDVNTLQPVINLPPLILALKVSAPVYMVDYLINAGANINYEDTHGNTPLYYTIKEPKYFDLTDKLIRNGADINKKYESNNTLLHEAALVNNVIGIKLLLDAGMKVDILNSNNQTPLHIACKTYPPNLEVIQQLVSRGAPLNVYDSNKNTPLIYLVVNTKPYPSVFNPEQPISDLTPIDFLLSKGAKTNVRVLSLYNQTLLQIAMTKCNYPLVKLLIDNGALVTEADINEANRIIRYKGTNPIDLDPFTRDLQYTTQKIYDLLSRIEPSPIRWDNPEPILI